MIEIPPSRVEFTLGRLQVTPAALAALGDSGEWVWTVIFQHMAGDWLQLTDAEREQNEKALVNGSPVTSRYMTRKGVELLVRTEAEPRRATTVMLAQEDQADPPA